MKNPKIDAGEGYSLKGILSEFKWPIAVFVVMIWVLSLNSKGDQHKSPDWRKNFYVEESPDFKRGYYLGTQMAEDGENYCYQYRGDVFNGCDAAFDIESQP